MKANFVDEAIAAAVNDYRKGNWQPLVGLIEMGAPEVLQNAEARALIVEKMRGRGRPPVDEAQTLRVQVVTYLYILKAYGANMEREIDEAVGFFNKSRSSIRDIWDNHNRDTKHRFAGDLNPRSTNIWLRAVEEGYALKRKESRRENMQSVRQKAYELASGDIYAGQRDGLRKAAAAGQLKQYDPKKTITMQKLDTSRG